MSERQRFWTTVALYSAIGLVYPIAVIVGDQAWAESSRWIKNDPGFTVFLVLVLPFVAGVLAVRMDLRPLRRLSKLKQRLSVGVLVLLVGLSVVVGTIDLGTKEISSPVQYRDPAPVLEHERRLRDGVRGAAWDHDDSTDADEESRKARDEYRARWPPIDSVKALGEIGSRAALVAFALNVFVGTFAAVLFWYLWLLVQFRSEWKSRSFDWLLLTVGLMLAWFPLRLYSEWYLHFFSLQGMGDYPAFQFLAVLAVIAYCVIAFRVTERVSVKVFATVATGLIGLLTAVAKLAPTWVEEIAWAIEGWDFSLYLTLLVILVLALSAMIWTLVDEGVRPARTAPAVAGGGAVRRGRRQPRSAAQGRR